MYAVLDFRAFNVFQHTKYSKLKVYKKYNKDNVLDFEDFKKGISHTLYFKILDFFNGNICESLFDFSYNLLGMIIPDDIVEIGQCAFGHTNLSSVIIPNSVQIINEYAFYNCEYIEDITLPNDLQSIGSQAFYMCHNLYSVEYKGVIYKNKNNLMKALLSNNCSIDDDTFSCTLLDN